jgi:histidinol dehydrogenase
VKIIDAKNQKALTKVLAHAAAPDAAFDKSVAKIVHAVRDEGDTALLAFARRFDDVRPPIEVSREEMERSMRHVPADVRAAIAAAAKNIARVAARQVPSTFALSVTPGVDIEQRVEPLARVGCYVPGGRFPLPSSLLMTAVPARVAGVPEIIVACPRPEPSVLAAALEAGVTRLFRIGGAHAIAALAYGTRTVPRVDKIVGPGNRWVAAAKALVSRDCAIDFYAGPTEIVIVASSGDPEWIAADLVAQAEHDPDARSIFITWNRGLATKVSKLVAAAAKDRRVVKASIDAHGAIVIVKDADEAVALANRIAPEHLVVDTEALAKRTLVAGALFVGACTAQAAGDYATGSNHVLPTAGAARFRGGLSASDFVRVMAVQRVNKKGLATLAPTILPLARAEGLRAHGESIEIRIRK